MNLGVYVDGFDGAILDGDYSDYNWWGGYIYLANYPNR